MIAPNSSTYNSIMEQKLGNFAMVAQDVCALPRSREAIQCYYNRVLIDAAVANIFPSSETNALSILMARVLQGHHLEESLIPGDGHLTPLVEPPNLIAASLRSVRQLQLRRTFQLGELKASLNRKTIFDANRLEKSTSKTCFATNAPVKDVAYLAQCQQAVQSYQMMVSPSLCHLHTKAMKGKSGESRGVIDSSASISLPESDSRGTVKEDSSNSTPVSANSSSHQTLKMLGLTCLERRAAKTQYFDASILEDPDCKKIKQYSRYHRNGVVEPFPEKLYRMLREVSHAGNEDIISFFPHGRAFVM